jgi:hypothetical protein
MISSAKLNRPRTPLCGLLRQRFWLLGIGLTAYLGLASKSIQALEINREYGESSFKFLKLSLSPRIVALAGAGSALADGVGELDLNPAAPASDSGHLVVGRGYPFSQFQGTTNVITWSVPYSGYRILLNARYLGFENIPGRDDLARSTTDYGSHTLKAQAGLAGSLYKLTWGTTVNFASNSIAEANYATAMLNMGLRYQVLKGLTGGLSVINADFWGSKAKFEGNRDPFPPTALQAGLAYTRAFGSAINASLALDARTRNDEEMAWPMGIEISWRNMLTGRLGFPMGEKEPALAGGLGIHWSRFQFQYAYQGHATLGAGQFWTLDIAY